MSHYCEPTDLEVALWERGATVGFAELGPLTREQDASERAYELYIREAEREEEARVAAGGREVCPNCGRRKLVSATVLTYGVRGRAGSEYSTLRSCEGCGYSEL